MRRMIKRTTNLTKKTRRPCIAMRGPNNPRWNGGVSDYPDHYLMKLRRLERLKKARGKCEICGDPANSIHHIDENKANHNIDNFLAVCNHCHKVLHSKEPTAGFLGYTSKYRRIYGMTINEIGSFLGISPSYVQHWLRGKRNFPPEILDRFSKLKPLNTETQNP